LLSGGSESGGNKVKLGLCPSRRNKKLATTKTIVGEIIERSANSRVWPISALSFEVSFSPVEGAIIWISRHLAAKFTTELSCKVFYLGHDLDDDFVRLHPFDHNRVFKGRSRRPYYDCGYALEA